MKSDRVTDVLLLGPYPPPWGGVSTHIQRLSAILIRNGLTVRVLNYFGQVPSVPGGTLNKNPIRFGWAGCIAKPRLVHFHHSRFSFLLAVAIDSRSAAHTRLLLTVHGQELTLP